MLTWVQGAATVREPANGPAEIPTTGAMMIAAANALAQVTHSTELLTIRAVLMAIFFTLPYLLNASRTCACATARHWQRSLRPEYSLVAADPRVVKWPE